MNTERYATPAVSAAAYGTETELAESTRTRITTERDAMKTMERATMELSVAGPVCTDFVSPADDVPHVLQRDYGSFLASITQILAAPAPTRGAPGGEIRLVEIPALAIMALWFSNGRLSSGPLSGGGSSEGGFSGDGDGVVVPLSPAPYPLAAGSEYPAEHFLRIVREMSHV